MKTFKERVQNKEIMTGTHININDPCVANIVAHLGFDYIWIDLEHSYLSYENLLSQIMIIQNAGTAVIVRVPQNDFTATKKVMEMGPDGIIFPMVRTKEEADALVSFTLYPPYGCRGFGPNNAIKFGIEDVKNYVHTNHETMCRFIQIEHVDLVNNLEEVTENPFIDGYIFGPNDLSGSINEILDVFGDNTVSLIDKSIEILKRKNKTIGLSTDFPEADVIKKWHDMGVHMISATSDFTLLRRGMAEVAESLDSFHRSIK